MKNLSIKVCEILKNYFQWLKSTPNQSKLVLIAPKTTIVKKSKDYLTLAISDLKFNPLDFKKHSKPGLLKTFLKVLVKTDSFTNRSEKERTKIILSFESYMLFIDKQNSI